MPPAQARRSTLASRTPFSSRWPPASNWLAEQCELQAARNDALAAVATAYFDVQEARGRLAGNLDAKAKAEDLVRRISGAGSGAGAARSKSTAFALCSLDLEQEVAASRAAWRTSSARLNRVLRLNPGAVVVPIEPPQLQVTLIPPGQAVDDLIPVGLMNRPELASQKALVQATLELLRQERLRPLIPSLVFQGGSGPGGAFNGGVFEGGPNGEPYTGGGRFDVEVGVVWTLEQPGRRQPGLGSRAGRPATTGDARTLQHRGPQWPRKWSRPMPSLRPRRSRSARRRPACEKRTSPSWATSSGISETQGAGELLELVNRPQEAVAALQQLNRAYDNYFAAVNGYNRAQFQLYRAMGYPARILVCDRPVGELQNVDTSRPAGMAPVCPHVLSRPCP